MKAKEKSLIENTIKELKEWAEQVDNQKDKDNLLNRVDALEWVLSIAG